MGIDEVQAFPTIVELAGFTVPPSLLHRSRPAISRAPMVAKYWSLISLSATTLRSPDEGVKPGTSISAVQLVEPNGVRFAALATATPGTARNRSMVRQ